MSVASPSYAFGRPPTANNVGVPVALTGLSVVEYGIGPLRQTVFTLTNVPITITDLLAYVGTKLYDFPLGRIRVLDCVATITPTTTSTIATTLKSGVNVSWGLGSATASSLTLATTMMNFMPGSGEAVNTFASSTVINVAAASDSGKLAAVSAAQLAAIVDGTVTAADLFLNLGVAAADIDGDATLTISGTITLTWINQGTI